MMSKLFAPPLQTMPVSSVYECVKSKHQDGAANAAGAKAKAAASIGAPATPNVKCLTLSMSPPLLSGLQLPHASVLS